MVFKQGVGYDPAKLVASVTGTGRAMVIPTGTGDRGSGIGNGIARSC